MTPESRRSTALRSVGVEGEEEPGRDRFSMERGRPGWDLVTSHPSVMSTSETSVLKPELQYFEQHRVELLAHATGKYALVKNAELVGVFDSETEALRTGFRRLGTDAFLVKHIVEADILLNFATFNAGA